MNKLKRYIILIIAVSIFVVSMIILQCIKQNNICYQVNYFNDTLKTNAMSTYYNGNYYYIDRGKYIYELNSANKNRCLAEGNNISGIAVLDEVIYYIDSERLYKYNIQTKSTEYADDENGYNSLSAYEGYVYALRYVNGNFSDYNLLKINSDEQYKITSSDSTINQEIEVFYKDGNYSYLNSSIPQKTFLGISNNHDVVFRNNDRMIKNLLYHSGNIIVTSDESGKKLRVYKNGILSDTIDMPENYSYIPQNVFGSEEDIYILVQEQNGYGAIGYYNLSQKKHIKDAIIKYSLKSGTVDFVYNSTDKQERIVGYKDNDVICLKKRKLYQINISTQKKDEIAEINESDTEFEMCFNKIFMWNNGKYVYSCDIGGGK